MSDLQLFKTEMYRLWQENKIIKIVLNINSSFFLSVLIKQKKIFDKTVTALY